MREGYSLFQAGQYDASVKSYQEALDLANNPPKLKDEYLDSLNALAFTLYRTDDFDASIPLFNEILEIYSSAGLTESVSYVEALRALISVYHAIPDLRMAESLTPELIRLSRQAFADYKDRLASALLTASETYEYSGDYGSALIVQEDILKLYIEQYGQDHIYVMNMKGRIATNSVYAGSFDKAEQIVGELLAIAKSNPGSDQEISALISAGTVYQNVQKYKEAITVLERLIELLRPLGTENHRFVTNLGRLVYNYNSNGQYKIAMEKSRELLDLSSRVFGEQSVNHMANLYAAALVYQSNLKFEEAVPLLQKTLDVYENFYGKEHAAYLNSLSTLASIYNSLNDSNALSLTDEILKLNTVLNKKGTVSYNYNLNIVTDIYKYYGQFNKAIPLLQELVSNSESVYGKNSREYVFSLKSLVDMFVYSGNFELAGNLVSELETLYNSLFKDSPELAEGYLSIGNVYMKLNDHTKAEQYIAEAVKISERYYGKDHARYAITLFDMAMLHMGTKDFNRALSELEVVKVIYGKAYGESSRYHRNVVSLINEAKVALIDSGELTRGSDATDETDVADTYTYHALIIGVEEYPDDPSIDPLNFPISDGLQLKEVLVDNYTFREENISLLKNPTRKKIIDTFRGMIKTLGNKDHLLIFYAGHGAYDNLLETGYWKPSDATSDSDANWLSRDDIVKYLRAMKTKHTLLISDACFSGSIFSYKRVRGNEDNSERTLTATLSANGRHAMTSALNKVVPDDSRFIEQLIRKLQNNEKDVLFSLDLFNSIREAVIWNTENNPQFGPIDDTNHEGGEFVFIKRKTN